MVIKSNILNKKIIAISYDSAKEDSDIISGGISTHVYEIYTSFDDEYKKDILLLANNFSDSPLGIDMIRLPFLNIIYLKLISFHFLAALYLFTLIVFFKAKPKIVHIHYIEMALLPALVARMFGCTVVVTSHGYYDGKKFIPLFRPFLNLMWKFLQSSITELVVLSDDAKNYYYNLFERAGLKNLPFISVVPNGAISRRLLKIIENCEPIEKNGSRILLFVGRLSVEKNVIGLLKAFKKIVEPDVILWIVGDGQEKSKLVNYASKIYNHDKIKFWGWQSRKNVFLLMRSADIFILPSLWEGMPIALLEAYFFGKKCICHRNTFTEKIPGIILLDSADPEELASKINVVLNTDIHPDNDYLKSYTWENSANSLIQVYRKYA